MFRIVQFTCINSFYCRYTRIRRHKFQNTTFHDAEQIKCTDVNKTGAGSYALQCISWSDSRRVISGDGSNTNSNRAWRIAATCCNRFEWTYEQMMNFTFSLDKTEFFVRWFDPKVGICIVRHRSHIWGCLFNVHVFTYVCVYQYIFRMLFRKV